MKMTRGLLAVFTASTLSGCGRSTEPNLGDLTHPVGTAIVNVALGQRPFGVALSTRGTVFATRLDSAAVTSFAADNSARTGNIGVGPVPTDVAFVPDGSTAYVTNQFGRSIGVIDVATAQQIATIPVQGDPFRVIVSRDGATVFATSNANSVIVIDAARRQVTREIAVCNAANGLALTRAGKLLYVGCPSANQIAIIDLQSNTVIRTVDGVAAQEVVLSPDEDELYVARLGGGLEVRRAGDLTLLATLADVPSTFGMAMSPDGVQLYATETLNGTVAVIDRVSRQRIATISTGGAPRRVAFTRKGDAAVVANEAGQVHFIR